MLKMKKKCYQTVNYFMKNLFGYQIKIACFCALCLKSSIDKNYRKIR